MDAALELFDIRDRADDQAAQLSKGLKQRVALARTLLHQPDVVLLDEPTSGLDPESARDVRELVLRLRDERRAVLLSTHNLDEVERVANRVAVLRTRLIAVDTPAALRARLFGARLRHRAGPAGRAVRGAAPAAGHATCVPRTARCRSRWTTRRRARRPSCGGSSKPAPDIQSVVPEEPPLEEVYLRLLQQEQPA